MRIEFPCPTVRCRDHGGREVRSQLSPCPRLVGDRVEDDAGGNAGRESAFSPARLAPCVGLSGGRCIPERYPPAAVSICGPVKDIVPLARLKFNARAVRLRFSKPLSLPQANFLKAAEPRAARPMSEERPMVQVARRPSSQHAARQPECQLIEKPQHTVWDSADCAAGGYGGYARVRSHPRATPAPCCTKPAAGMSRVDPTVKAVLPSDRPACA